MPSTSPSSPAAFTSPGHWQWVARLGVDNDPRYNKTRCFDPFPFPDPDVRACVPASGELGEQLDAHRKARQAAHPGLTMTGMYNVLERLRKGEELSAKERVIHEEGLVSVLLGTCTSGSTRRCSTPTAGRGTSATRRSSSGWWR